jgi:hypothetical protein
MERYWRRRGLLLISSPVILVTFLRKRTVQLAIALVAYFNAETLLGVKPYTPIQLVEFFTSNIEGAIGFVGIVVAFAAGRGFIESKQLDLRLALEAEIADLSRDASKLLEACRRAANAMAKVQQLGDAAVNHSIATNASKVVFPPEMDGAFRDLILRSIPLGQAQDDLAYIGGRFGEITRKFGPVVRSSLITSLCLQRAELALDRITSATTLMVVEEGWCVESFLLLQAQHKGSTPEQLLAALNADELRFQSWMGGASAVGAGSIFRPSSVLAALLWWELWKVRE